MEQDGQTRKQYTEGAERDSFHFTFSELKEEQKDLAQASILNQAGISRFYLSCREPESPKTIVKGLCLTDQSKAAPLLVF